MYPLYYPFEFEYRYRYLYLYFGGYRYRTIQISLPSESDYDWITLLHKIHHDIIMSGKWQPLIIQGSPNGRNHYSFYGIGYGTKKLLLHSAKLSTKFQTKKLANHLPHCSLSYWDPLCLLPFPSPPLSLPISPTHNLFSNPFHRGRPIDGELIWPRGSRLPRERRRTLQETI
jgi:hypothetical protein